MNPESDFRHKDVIVLSKSSFEWDGKLARHGKKKDKKKKMRK